MNDGQELYSKILEVFRNDDAQKIADFKHTRYASILWIATYLRNYKRYIRTIENYTCFNYYRLGKVADYVRINYDRGKQARRVFEELEKVGEVLIFVRDNKTYVCLTDKGMAELSQKIQELWELRDYHAQLNVASHTSKISSYNDLRAEEQTKLPKMVQSTKSELDLVSGNESNTQHITSNEKYAEKELIDPYNDSRLRILLVDDEPDITAILKLILEQNGFAVDTFNDPSLALSNYKIGKYGLLLLDIKMPKMDGFELYREIKNIDNNVGVIYITAYEIYHEGIKENFPQLSDENFILKPFPIEDLVEKIKRFNRDRCQKLDIDQSRLIEFNAKEYVDNSQFESALDYLDGMPVRYTNSSELRNIIRTSINKIHNEYVPIPDYITCENSSGKFSHCESLTLGIRIRYPNDWICTHSPTLNGLLFSPLDEELGKQLIFSLTLEPLYDDSNNGTRLSYSALHK